VGWWQVSKGGGSPCQRCLYPSIFHSLSSHPSFPLFLPLSSYSPYLEWLSVRVTVMLTVVCGHACVLKSQPLVACLDRLGCRCKVVALIFGSHVHRIAVRGLQIVGLTKTRAQQLARYCFVSAVVGSLTVWRRCFLYP
jgi:hypothetical protein